MSNDKPKMTPIEGKDEPDRIEQVESSLRVLMACKAVQDVRDDLNNWHQRRRGAPPVLMPRTNV